jgi:hypothetical protein
MADAIALSDRLVVADAHRWLWGDTCSERDVGAPVLGRQEPGHRYPEGVVGCSAIALWISLPFPGTVDDACDTKRVVHQRPKPRTRGLREVRDSVTTIRERPMAKRFALAFVLIAALLAGCAGADSSAPQDSVEDVGPEPTSASTTTASCGELADELVAQMQVIVDELSDARLEDLGRDDLLPAGTQQQLDDLEGRVQDAGCDDEMDRLLAERADRIQGGGVIAEAVREGLSEGGDLPF